MSFSPAHSGRTKVFSERDLVTLSLGKQRYKLCILPGSVILGKYCMHIGSLWRFPQMENKEGSKASAPVDCRTLRKEAQIQSSLFPSKGGRVECCYCTSLDSWIKARYLQLCSNFLQLQSEGDNKIIE